MRNYRARGITKDNKPIFDETHEHEMVAAWLYTNGVYFIHVPNEGKRNRFTGAQLRRMGMTKGVVDFLIFDPPPLMPMSIGAVMELKAIDGRKPTDEQYKFMSEMGVRRYANSWWKGADDCIQWLSEKCGYGKRR